MKLSFWLLGALAATLKVAADDNVAEDLPLEPTDDVELTKFQLSYIIEEHPDLSPSEAADLLYGETITLNYNIVNNEDSTLTVVGLGGAFRDPLTGEPAINMTANSVEPLVIEPETSGTMRQKINLEFPPGDYVLAPHVYVAFHDQLKGIPARGQLVSVTEPPVSFFNPQMLFLELIFFGTIGSAVYYFYGKTIDKYFKGTAPVTKKGQASGSASGYEGWVPKNYHPVEKKSKMRKAY